MSCGCNKCSCSPCTCVVTCPEFCTALTVTNSWNVPACGASATLYIPGLVSVLIGTFLANPSYGFFEITGFNSINSQVTVLNNCYEQNADPGTVVPAGTKFILSASAPAQNSEQGWFNPVSPGDSWGYLSATTMTVPSDATLVYQKGDKVWLQQGGVDKYFYIIEVTSSTVVTITGGTDYTLANAVIANPRISREDVPFGFPDFFNWNPAPTGFSVNPVGVYRFSIKGIKCSLTVYESTAGTSNSTTFQYALPVVAKVITNQNWIALGEGVDNGTALVDPIRVIIGEGLSYVDLRKDLANTVWTNSGNKKSDFQAWYEI